MIWESITFKRLLLLAPVALAMASCLEEGPPKSAESSEGGRDGFFRPDDIAVAEDGLAYAAGESEPFTGAVVTRDKDWQPRYFAYYYEGKLHGPEMRWHEDGTFKRIFDYHHGDMDRRREFFENGNIDLDALIENGESIGRHRRWYEDGSVRWQGSFKPNLQWHGPIKDFAEDGTVLWDAMFENGRYIGGIYPESEKQNLIDAGMLDEGGKPTAEGQSGMSNAELKKAPNPNQESGER